MPGDSALNKVLVAVTFLANALNLGPRIKKETKNPVFRLFDSQSV